MNGQALEQTAGTDRPEERYLFTVFTPTYNRANTLGRVFESLAAQTLRDFEWLIVDDGSSDDTESLVRGWQERNEFPIRYIRQDHGGKHVAFNRGVREAHGRLFLTLDSDDACVPNALERFKAHWEGIPEEQRERFSAVTGLCRTQDGKTVGRPFPTDPLDSDSLEMAYRYRMAHEKWGFQRTDVLRQFPFPEDVEGNYVPESYVWHRIARHYKTRYVNDALRIYWTEGESLLRQTDPGHNAGARRVYYLFVLNTEMDWFRFAPKRFFKTAVQYARFSYHAGLGFWRQFRDVKPLSAKALFLAAAPMARVLFARDARSRPTAPAPSQDEAVSV